MIFIFILLLSMILLVFIFGIMVGVHIMTTSIQQNRDKPKDRTKIEPIEYIAGTK